MILEPVLRSGSRLEEIETHARNLCAQHDVTGALTLVASDGVWNSIPANLANAAGVLQQAEYAVTWAQWTFITGTVKVFKSLR
jgi:hypothetical protein